jgi:predicted PurR-regulated permease PerM
LLQPLVSLLEGARVPKPVGALIALGVLVSVFVGLGMLLSSPAARWASELPEVWPQLQRKFVFIKDPVEHLQRTLEQMGIQFESPSRLISSPVGMATAVFGGTGTVVAHLLETFLVLFYLLAFGETFLRRLVEVLPTFANKRDAVEISLQVERDLSAYLLTITVINAAVGCATGGVMWLCGVAAPVLWCGSILPELCSDTRPILWGHSLSGGRLDQHGTRLGGSFAGGSLLRYSRRRGGDRHANAAREPLYDKSRRSDPVVVFLVLDMGGPGAILAVPMLAIIKIISDRIRPLRAFGHLLEG